MVTLGRKKTKTESLKLLGDDWGKDGVSHPFLVEIGTWGGLKEELGQREVSVSGDTRSVMEMVALRVGLFVHCPLAMALAQRGQGNGVSVC